ncbi:hypothetical protein [Sulfobacillus thermosulfidooxidans]|uniref:hypothetical protein n=1 Tax=Sulfobacillus thermosulfidooxidans TaxID=28034 RepID=UPI0006B4A7DF|nr:hypothetical protein [Sulfobacillus thermosulfidooxidans]
MTDHLHDKLGERLDHALGEGMGLYFNTNWHPKKVMRRQSYLRRTVLGAVAASVAGLVLVPHLHSIRQSQASSSERTLAAPALSSSIKQVLQQFSDEQVQVIDMSPVYAKYPMAVPTGHALTLSGKFTLGQITGTSLVLKLDNRRHVLGGTLFSQGVPIYDFVGHDATNGQVISPHPSSTPLKGTWVAGLPTPITSFAAAGPYIYLTHNNTWAVLHGQSKAYWAVSPGPGTNNMIDTISALPTKPNDVLLVEENPSGQSVGYVSTDRGRHWTTWAIGSATFSNVVAMDHHYWAIVNGTLQVSQTGIRWNSLLPLNTKRWQVEDYAINPANSQQIAVALVPVAGTGIGPVLETQNGGQSWHQLPHFPALGAAPSSMVMSPAGGISALVNLSNPVLVRYSPTSHRWTAIAVPSNGQQVGVGQLAASPNGDLFYGSPTGAIYRWVKSDSQWQYIAPPSASAADSSAPYPLEAIGNHQILAGYADGWSIFVISPSPAR